MRQSFDFTTKNKFRDMRPELRKARSILLDHAIAHPTPFSQETAAQVLEPVLGSAGPDLVREMVRHNFIGTNEDGNLAHLYPVSCEETVHRVRLADGREFWAMCAIDALGCAATFDLHAEVFSATKDTGDPVYASVGTDRLETVTPAGMLVSYYDNWAEEGVNY